MARFVRLSMLLTLAAALAVPAMANIPTPEDSIVPGNAVLYQRTDVIVATGVPATAKSIEISVAGPTGTITGATVDIVVRTANGADGLVCWCVSGAVGTFPQPHPVMTEVTDGSGEAEFTILGGGCVDPARFGDVVADVFADGIKIGETGFNSPDAVNSVGDLPTDDGYAPDASCVTGLGDAVFHTGPIANSLPEYCSDFTGDGTVDGNDAVLVTPSIVNAASCTP